MAADTPFILSKKIQDAVLEYQRQCYQLTNSQFNIRESMRAIDLEYIRENDATSENLKARLANSYGDSNKFQNVTVPVVMPQVEAAVAYQSAVFLQGNPLFGVVSDVNNADAALQMESLIGENSIRGGWARELMMGFRDGFKYNFAPMEISWCKKITAALETDTSFSAKEAKPKEVIWEGNKIKRWDPYNTFFDSRYMPSDIPERGEFMGQTELLSRVALKSFIAALPDKMNITAAFESGLGTATVGSGGIESYYIPIINPNSFLQQDIRRSTDWLAWAAVAQSEIKINYRNLYEVTTLYARIIPSDFGMIVPSSNTPQIWKFIFVNHQVLIYAERQTNAHNLLPVLIMQPNEDGLGYQTKSLAVNIQPMQQVSTAMMNSVIAARRRAISDRTLYDPSRITAANINSDNPSAKIPVRPAAYGKNVAEAVYAFPFRDDQSPLLMQEISSLGTFADTISGRNKAQQGQFVKGNKTLHEYADVMSHANGRDQMCSMLLEAQFFTPAKEILKINYLQYQGGTSLYNPEKKQVVTVDPVALRNSVLSFKISDGLIPSDKLMNSDAFSVALQTMASSPQIGASYNMGPMFSYMMKTQRADIAPFEKSQPQVAYEQALSSWQQAMQQWALMSQEITIAAIKQGADTQKLKLPDQPPQPKPEDFGYQTNGAPQTK